MMRIALFLLTNLAVMVVFGLVLSLTGIQSSSVQVTAISESAKSKIEAAGGKVEVL